MINLSKSFRQALYNDDRVYDVSADITLKTGKKISLHGPDLWAGGFTIDDALCEDSAFQALGATPIGSADLSIKDDTEMYASYDFYDAKVELYLAKTLQEPTGARTEKIKKGTYLVDEATFSGPKIDLYCVDYMCLLEKPYSESTLSYPASLSEIVRDCCTKCGVSLQSYDFPHSSFVIKERPAEDAVTFREVLGWAAAIAGCFARFNRDGKLELKWFNTSTLESRPDNTDGGVFDSGTPYQTGVKVDGGAFNPWNDGAALDGSTFDEESELHYLSHLTQRVIGIDDVVITGVEASVPDEDDEGNEIRSSFISGTKGYTITIEDNELITVENAAEIVAWLGAQLNGLTFRQAKLTHLNDPSIEAGDVALVWDWKDREHPILITRTTFSITGTQETVCAAETPNRHSAQRFSEATKTYVEARKHLVREINARQKALEELMERLESAEGLYTTVEPTSSGSVFYLHDRPTLEDSKTIWKMNGEALGVSTDGGKSWNAGLTVDGDMITRILSAIGINADWINAGSIAANRIDVQYTNALKSYSDDIETRLSADIGAIDLSVKSKVGKNEIINAINLDSSGTKISASKFSVDADTIRLKASTLKWSSDYSSLTETGVLTTEQMIAQEMKVKYGLEIYSMNANAGEAYIDFHSSAISSTTDYNGRFCYEGGWFKLKTYGGASTGKLECGNISSSGTISCAKVTPDNGLTRTVEVTVSEGGFTSSTYLYFTKGILTSVG